jgi:ankyrin repeat protein
MEAEKRKVLDILYEDNIGQMAKYLREGGNPNFSINGEETPLCVAESVEMAKLLVDAGADIHYRGYRNMTPLLWQAGSSRPNMLAYLLSLDPNLIRDLESSGETALHRCVRHAYVESLECAKILLAANPPVNINAISNGYTALDLAVESRNVATESIIKLLLDHGAVRNNSKRSRYDDFIDEYITSTISSRNVPRGSENGIELDEIKEGNVMVNFPTNNAKTEYNFKRYYKNSLGVRGMAKNPQTRRPLNPGNFKLYKAHLVDSHEGGKKKGRKSRSRKTRKSARK